MRKIDKFALGKADIAQIDLLQKKEMKNILGGLTCFYYCAKGGAGKQTLEYCSDLNDCYDQWAEICGDAGGNIWECH